MQQRFQLFFKGQKNSAQAFAMFSIINECLDPNHINSIDLSLQFRSREGKLKSVSLTDYIDCMLEKDPNNVPHKDFVVVHNYVTKHCNVPAIFLLNKHFVWCDEKKDEIKTKHLFLFLFKLRSQTGGGGYKEGKNYKKVVSPDEFHSCGILEGGYRRDYQSSAIR